MSNDLRTSIVIDLTGNLERRAVRYGRSIERMSQRGERHLNRMSRAAATTGRVLDRMGNRYTAMIAGAGAGLLAKRALDQSADLDKQLIRLAQTAGRNIRLTRDLRKTFFEMARDSGQSVEDLLSGYNNLIQAGQTWEEALATIAAINPAIAVTGANAQVLASGLTVAAEAFNFDLSKPEMAVDLLDKMTVAGRLGNAELEDLSRIFARIGVNAKDANLGFADTLGFIEQLSLVERDPARLATLADSTLRLFTNNKYLQKAQKVTGVSFFDAENNRRDPLAVLQEIA
ncbi:MAG: phage tail tape measure protein [Chromatiales bacterium]|nr:phage tail tape measure protein [Gammaproteobacteria bacterium]